MFSTKPKLLKVLILCFFSINAYCQKIEFGNSLKVLTDLKSPTAAQLENFGNLNVSYQSGSPNIAIPIFTLEAKHFRYPISLSYTAKGIPVNAVAGVAGLGWHMNAVSSITYQRFGEKDFLVPFNSADNQSNRRWFTLSNSCGGTCTGNCTYTNGQDKTTALLYSKAVNPKDLPEIYSLNTPVINGKFFFQGRSGFTMPASDLKIDNYIQSTDNFTVTSGGIHVRDTEGNLYIFSSMYDAYANNGLFLTKILTADNDSIKFYYNKVNIRYRAEPSRVSIEHMKGQYPCSGGFTSYPQEENVPKENKLEELFVDSIVAGNGTKVEFIYSARKDLVSLDNAAVTAKKLDRVNVYDYNRNLKKQFAFRYSYFGDSTNTENCYLKLLSFRQVVPGQNLAMKHTFDYNPIVLPGRLYSRTDTIGYYTRLSGNDINIKGARDTIASGACMLERINYPSGGYTLLKYENNKLLYKTPLRIKTLADYTPDGKQYNFRSFEYQEALSYNKNYRYEKVMYELKSTCVGSSAAFVKCPAIMRTSTSLSDLYESYYYANVDEGYPKVTEYFGSDTALGKKEYYYTIPQVNVEYGIWNPTVLLSKELTYKKTNTGFKLISEVENSYNDFAAFRPADRFEEVNHPAIRRTRGLSFSVRYEEQIAANCNGVPGVICSPYDIEQWSIVLNSVPVLPTKKITRQYADNIATPITSTESYLYNETRSLSPTTIITTNSKDETITVKKGYAFSFPGVAVYDSMQARNMKSITVKDSIFNNSTRIFVTTNNYGFTDASGKLIAPASYEIQHTNNSPEVRLTYHRYDAQGNILERSKTNDVHEVYLWGYNNTYPVAKILGSTYDQVIAIVNPNILQRPASDQQLRDELNKIRTTFANSNVQISTYTYAPLIGITSETDAAGRTTFYEYDAFSRLKAIRDMNNKILKYYCYNYAGQQTECTDAVYYNTALSGTFTKNDCPSGYNPQGPVVYTVPAGKYGSLQSQQAADAQAQSDMTANGQLYANNNSGCWKIYYNQPITRMVAKNDCPNDYPGIPLPYTVDSARYTGYTQDDANQKAINEIDANGQAYANANGSCATLYANEIQSQWFTRNNCGTGYTGGQYQYTVAAGTYHSSVSTADANQQALNDINANGQNQANLHGTCTCDQEGYKLINGNCEKGTKVPFQEPISGGQCRNGYYYQFSDGSTSVKYYTSTTAC
ncbi:YD repeat-containing protein [Chitinophaga eiseniae]|uniref:YD repeat-containing protein n=1 Tax=Chitinophaga eiseniae TaxID=634771 RepID=A0A1T4R4K7_9BACT|nr:DUF5977 domain-containing protein [Chitinophaga eiseniae]SKA10795.1 YD repeat-containing protein [Chitinophaga eiseniae]